MRINYQHTYIYITLPFHMQIYVYYWFTYNAAQYLFTCKFIHVYYVYLPVIIYCSTVLIHTQFMFYLLRTIWHGTYLHTNLCASLRVTV